MTAIDLLQDQHRELNKLFLQCEEATSRKEKDRLFEQITDSFIAHCEIEERVFYPAVFVGELKESLREAVEEHLSAKRIVLDVSESKPSDEVFEAKTTVLKELIDHHVDEEEHTLFPKVRRNFSQGELQEIGDQMKALLKAVSPKTALKQVEQSPTEATFDEEWISP